LLKPEISARRTAASIISELGATGSLPVRVISLMTDDGKKLASWSVKKVDGVVAVVEVGLEEFGMDSGTGTDMCVEMIGLAPGLALAARRYYCRGEDAVGGPWCGEGR
jgi:hypothetical protein